MAPKKSFRDYPSITRTKGGHVNTYVDPVSGQYVNYGVLTYLRYSDAADFFARFNVPIQTFIGSATPTLYVSTVDGSNLTEFTPPSRENQIDAMDRWYNLIQQYANITLPGLWNFPPGPDIPDELLLPFGKFAKHHSIEDVIQLFTAISNVGIGGIEDELTLYVLFAMGLPVTREYLSNSMFQPVNASNSILYARAYDLLYEDVVLQSRVTHGERSEDGVKLVVQSWVKDGTTKRQKLIKAKRMLFSPPPSVSNLEPFRLEPGEISALSTFTPTWSFGAVARIPAVTPPYTVSFYAPASDTKNYLGIRDWPWTLRLESAPDVPAEEHLFKVIFAANYSLSHAEAKETITAAVSNLTSGNGAFAPDSSSGNATLPIEFLSFVDHNSILWRQSPSKLRSGIVQDIYALQGKHSTWYTGGLWSADYTGNVWAFTEDLLPRLVADLKSSGAR